MNGCIFCKIANGEAKTSKVYEDECCIAFFDINPANEYHTLVVPKQHYYNIFDIPEYEYLNLMKSVKKVVSILDTKANIQNLQIINSSGSEAQQDVMHIHFHVLPRHTGDGNDINWNTKLEIREKFKDLLQNITG